MELRISRPEETAKTAAFAQRVFQEYYHDLIGPKQARYMAELFLSEEAISRLMKEGAIFKIVTEADEIIAFYEYKIEKERVFLSKLYVDRPFRHQGLGRLMFDDLLSETKKAGLNKIYLTVNKGNTPSYEIYKHLGFEVTEAVVNDIGQGYVMDDYVMEYTISDL